MSTDVEKLRSTIRKLKGINNKDKIVIDGYNALMKDSVEVWKNMRQIIEEGFDPKDEDDIDDFIDALGEQLENADEVIRDFNKAITSVEEEE